MELEHQRIVVTGGTGFLGQHLCAELRRHGAVVEAIGRARYDLRSRAEIDSMLHETDPAAVVHLAAVVGGIGANEVAPGRFFYENAIMGIELLEACRKHGVAKVVIAGTVCAYPKFAPVPFKEDDIWDGYPEETNAPYGLAKKMLLVQAQAYRREYGLNAIYLLPVNLYGPGDNFDLATGHVIPGMIRKFIDATDSRSTTVDLWGDGSPTREFLFVEDAARAFRLALQTYDGPEPVNIGSGTEISIRDLAELIGEAVGFRGNVRWNPDRPNGQPRRRLNTQRAALWLGFSPHVGLAEGLRRTIDWYRSIDGWARADGHG